MAAAQNPPAPVGQDFNRLLDAGETARDENRNDQAIQLFRQALLERPESEEALWYLSTLLYEKGQYAESRDVLRQFVTIRNDAGPAWALLGICEFQLREYPRALDHFQHAMTEGVGDRKDLAQILVRDFALLLTRFERYDESQEALDVAEPAPSLTEAAGLAGLRMPLLPDEIPPDRRELVDLAGEAVLAVKAEHNEEAESKFKRLLDAYPNEPGVHFLYGAYLARQQPEAAVPEFERELEISPFHVLARIRLAEQLIALRDFDRALTLAQQAIQLDPKRASAHAYAGEALIGKGNRADGMKELETARAADPSIVRVHWDLLRVYTAMGRKEDAEREKLAIQELSAAQAQSRPPEAKTSTQSPAAP